MSNGTEEYEKQLDAMRKMMEALKPLEKDAQHAVLGWVDLQVGRVEGNKKLNTALPPQQNPNADASSLVVRRPGTVSTVAQKLGANTCRSILTAAAAYLSIYQGKESFTRDELIGCGKEARGWKADYSNQMATNISRMLDSGVMFEKAKDLFSLSEDELKNLQTKLAL
jgi:hypothetical protein